MAVPPTIFNAAAANPLAQIGAPCMGPRTRTNENAARVTDQGGVSIETLKEGILMTSLLRP